jgi:hypothetical protein
VFFRLYNAKADRTFKELEDIAKKLRKISRGYSIHSEDTE